MRKALFAAAACSLLCAACTTVVHDARPVARLGGFGGPAATAANSSAPPTADARPQVIDLANRQACELLTEQQRNDLDINRAGQNLQISLFRATGCSWTDIGVSNIVVPVVSEGIEAWTNGERQGEPADIDPIAGFRAITVTLPNDPDRCDVMVDTADGQYLATAFSVISNTPERYPEPCSRAKELAGAAMQNLTR
ncbi:MULTISPECIES: DUF3558 domain-containing protein [Actinosynnema]|uniref:DUF3558 domain-containing protein n=1 Tax=Actinosynnema TaxID=40566 RepID=UPI0020A5A850|nr:DUF3558 domain-containing protein [Actinosynnema pretiosum]